jgi:hypothetical protein
MTRLTSSGIDQSWLRSPDSMCATRIPRLRAATAPASVELTSPATTTSSGASSANVCSSSSAADSGVRASSCTCGRGSASSAKKTSFSSAS